MPQIDLADYAELFAHLNAQHILVTRQEFDPNWLKIRQCMHTFQAARFSNPILRDKPVLIGMDLCVLDGNSRVLGHIRDKAPTIPCYVIDRSFDEALRALYSFPKTYRYCEGPQPYRI